MTTIAWDGETLAADRRCLLAGTLIAATTKIHRVATPNEVVLCGYSGETAAGQELMAWLGSDQDPDKFPAAQRDKDMPGRLMVVYPDGGVMIYEDTPYPIALCNNQMAIGSGRDFAIAAMHCGRSAYDAVMVASLFDPATGNGVDTLEFATLPSDREFIR